MKTTSVTFKLSKLVRDKIPELFDTLHHTTRTRRLEGTELVTALKAKLIEEATELAQTSPSDQKHELEELADILQVLLDMTAARGLTMETVETVRQAKFDVKGGFNHGIFVDTVCVPSDDEKWLAYYRANPERFPEQIDCVVLSK